MSDDSQMRGKHLLLAHVEVPDGSSMPQESRDVTAHPEALKLSVHAAIRSRHPTLNQASQWEVCKVLFSQPDSEQFVLCI